MLQVLSVIVHIRQSFFIDKEKGCFKFKAKLFDECVLKISFNSVITVL